jgi:hypothetical protein
VRMEVAAYEVSGAVPYVTAFDLVAAKLERAKKHHIAELNRELFAPVVFPVPVRPLTRRQRVALRAAAVGRYFSVLWAAVRGKAVHEREAWDFDY